jgi:hypothetical protein
MWSSTKSRAVLTAAPATTLRVLSRLRRGPMSWKKLAVHLKADLEYLDDFARFGDAAVSDRLYYQAHQKILCRKPC